MSGDLSADIVAIIGAVFAGIVSVIMAFGALKKVILDQMKADTDQAHIKMNEIHNTTNSTLTVLQDRLALGQTEIANLHVTIAQMTTQLETLANGEGET